MMKETTHHSLSQFLQDLITRCEERDLSAIELLLSDDVEYSAHKKTWKGKKQVMEALQNELNREEIYIFKKREVIDSQQLYFAMEAVIRYKEGGTPRIGYQERQIAWILIVDQDLNITNWMAWMDPIWQVYIRSLETPLPTETWQPSCDPGSPLTREQITDLIKTKVHAYTNEDLVEWGKTVHDEVIIHPPWDNLLGHDCCEKAVDVYFKNYKDTIITPLRLLFDETKPSFVVYQQIFQTTNKTTGKQGKDVDFVFIEVAQEKIRYWRTYFDTDQSVQKQAQTFRSTFYSKGVPQN